MRDIKRSPQNVLNSLSKHSGNPDYKFERLYRNLFNEEMFYLAYQNIYAKPGNMTEGADGKTIDEMSLSRIEKLMVSLKDETYQPNPSRRIYILKKNGKKRPLGIPSFDDKLVQEVIRMLLEAIYERYFKYTSHGFRPNRSCQTALLQTQKEFSGAKWFIEGDIKGFFDNINHDILIGILIERIEDNRFIRLIRKFLNAGYVEDWIFHKTYSGTPQGGIISPILANIYLDKLDRFMEDLIKKFDKGIARQLNPQQHKLGKEKSALTKQLELTENENERKVLIAQIKAIEKERLLSSCGNEIDDNYKRLKYIRYADDFLIGIIGSKEDSKQIKENIKKFLGEKLLLELSDEKTLITHTETPAKFLGYEVSVRKSNDAKRDAIGKLKRVYNKRVVLNISMDVMKSKLLYYNVLLLKHHNGHEVWKPQTRSRLINNDDLEILARFNSEIMGLYNFYSAANNCSKLHSFKYIMEYSMYKTFAAKYKTTVRKILRQYKQDKDFTVFYTNKSGEKKARVFYNKGFKRKKNAITFNVDTLPDTGYTMGTTGLIDRLQARKCELCGKTDTLEMHHVRKVKDLKGKSPWEKLMIARQRKTMAVCHKCHWKIHNGD